MQTYREVAAQLAHMHLNGKCVFSWVRAIRDHLKCDSATEATHIFLGLQKDGFIHADIGGRVYSLK